MKFLALLAAVAAVAPTALGSLTINSPDSVTTCEPTQLQWNGGQAPYYLTALPAGQPSATPIERFPTQNGTSYTWLVDLQSGTSISLGLKDSSGAVAYSSIITVQAGTSTSCLSASSQSNSGSSSGASPAASSGSAPSSATGSDPSSSTPSASGTPASSASSSSPSSGSSSSSPSGSSASSTSGAGRLGVSTAFGVAGVMGLIGAALF